MYFGILVLEQVVNVALSKRRFQMWLGLAVRGSEWIMLHGVAGSSGISGQGTTFYILRVCAPTSPT